VTRLVLVRHGQAAAGWDAAHDPGLSQLGHSQAERAAAALQEDAAADSATVQLVTSPLLRARDTAAPLERAWRRAARVEPAVGEITSPMTGLADRAAWLGRIMSSRWPDLDGDLQAWRRRVIDALCALSAPTVVFTHFIAINVAVGAATGDDVVVCFAPDHASRTVLEVVDGRLQLIARGAAMTSATAEPIVQ
jgi:broad specificity phosphatase PhoE